MDLIPEARPATAILWRIEFWMIQFMTWIWASGQQDYFDSGEFTFLSNLFIESHSDFHFFLLLTVGKLRYSVIINLKIVGAAGALFLIFLIYIAVSNHMTQQDVFGFIAALSNTIGLTLLICLLGMDYDGDLYCHCKHNLSLSGHGLVELPRKLWFDASLIIYMKHYLFKLVFFFLFV